MSLIEKYLTSEGYSRSAAYDKAKREDKLIEFHRDSIEGSLDQMRKMIGGLAKDMSGYKKTLKILVKTENFVAISDLDLMLGNKVMDMEEYM